MKIDYASSKVKKYFNDFDRMNRKLESAWVKTIKKQIDALRAADTYQDFLSLGLWRPEPLVGSNGDWSLRVAPNVRMIIRPDADSKSVMLCCEVEVKGVCDYHGDKENWYIP